MLFIPRLSGNLLALSLGFFAIGAPDYARGASDFVGDAVKGEVIFKKCKACHKIGEGAKNSTGPVLTSVVGRAAGSFEGYKYGKGMRAANEKGLVWDEEKIFNYLRNPKKYLRAYLGNKKAKAKMKFKLKKENERKDVIAYLLTFASAKADNMEMKKPESNTEANAALPFQMAKSNQICIQNNYPKELLLTAETIDGKRELKTVGQNGYLCIESEGEGTVGVFENIDALEGCSRLAKAGKTEVLIAYASFDNCAWK